MKPYSSRDIARKVDSSIMKFIVQVGDSHYEGRIQED